MNSIEGLNFPPKRKRKIGPASKTSRRPASEDNEDVEVIQELPFSTNKQNFSSKSFSSLLCKESLPPSSSNSLIPNIQLDSQPQRNGLNMNRPNMVPNPCSVKKQRHISGSFMKAKITCVFCSDVISLDECAENENVSNIELRKMLRALYYNFELKPQDVPEDCSGSMFPFCKICKSYVAEIYKDQCAIDNTRKRIKETTNLIERVVADAELLRSKTIVKEEKVESWKLTDKILEGYRNKLLLKKKEREYHILGMSEILESSGCSRDDDGIIRGQFVSLNQEDRKPNVVFETDDGTSTSTVGVRGITVEVNPMDVHPNDEDFDVTDAMDNSGLVGSYNEKSCTMVISDVRSEPGSPRTSANDAVPVVLKKDEFARTQDRILSREPLSIDGNFRSKRTLYKGINIFRIQTERGFSLQCGICDHRVPITDQCFPGGSPSDLITAHITNRHQDKIQMTSIRKSSATTPRPSLSSSAAAKAASALQSNQGTSLNSQERKRRAYRFSCPHCDEKFPLKHLRRIHVDSVHLNLKESNPKSLKIRNPNASSPYEMYAQIYECDICLRPVKGTFQNLQVHKFSHKNDEERKEAIERGEPGARASFLYRNRNGYGLNKKRKLNNVPKRRGRKPKYNVTKSSWPNQPGKDLSHKCHLCPRTFSQKNYLLFHLRKHSRMEQKQESLAEAAPAGQPTYANVAARVPPLTVRLNRENGKQNVVNQLPQDQDVDLTENIDADDDETVDNENNESNAMDTSFSDNSSDDCGVEFLCS